MQLAARLVKVCAQQLVPVREALIWILLLVDATVRSADWQPAEAVWQMTVTGRPGRAGGMAEQEEWSTSDMGRCGRGEFVLGD